MAAGESREPLRLPRRGIERPETAAPAVRGPRDDDGARSGDGHGRDARLREARVRLDEGHAAVLAPQDSFRLRRHEQDGGIRGVEEQPVDDRRLARDATEAPAFVLALEEPSRRSRPGPGRDCAGRAPRRASAGRSGRPCSASRSRPRRWSGRPSRTSPPRCRPGRSARSRGGRPGCPRPSRRRSASTSGRGPSTGRDGGRSPCRGRPASEGGRRGRRGRCPGREAAATDAT